MILLINKWKYINLKIMVNVLHVKHADETTAWLLTCLFLHKAGTVILIVRLAFLV